jgi:hypothetical protein
MKISLKSLVLSTAALCATAAFAANHSRVDVPFSFTAKGQSFPAGSYNVALDANHNFITMDSASDTSKHITWNVGPADKIDAPALVKFDQVGPNHALRSVQVGSRITPNLDTQHKIGVSATTSIGGQ